jgi:hypothetical protein
LAALWKKMTILGKSTDSQKFEGNEVEGGREKEKRKNIHPFPSTNGESNGEVVELLSFP